MKEIPSAVQLAKDLVNANIEIFPYPQRAAALIAETILQFYSQIDEYLKEDTLTLNVGIDVTKLDEI